jgi:hypothetical protein
MEDHTLAFQTFWVQEDYSESEARAEFERLRMRQRLVSRLIDDLDYSALPDLLDCLSSQGINPDTYLEHTMAIMDGRERTGNLLWMPTYE